MSILSRESKSIKEYAQKHNISVADSLVEYLSEEPFPLDWCVKLNVACGSPLTPEELEKCSASQDKIDEFFASKEP